MPTPPHRPRIDAIWLRTDSSPAIERAQKDKDPSGRDQVLRVLVKLVGQEHWRIAIEYQVSPTGQLISHISEAHAFDRKPIDPVTSAGQKLTRADVASVARPASDAVPPIAETARLVLAAHGLILCRTPIGHAAPSVVKPLTGDEHARIFDEIAAQSLAPAQPVTSAGQKRADVEQWIRAMGPDEEKMVQAAVIHVGPGHTLELVDEGARIRIRVDAQTAGKASVFLTDADLDRLGKEVAYMQKQRAQRAHDRDQPVTLATWGRPGLSSIEIRDAIIAEVGMMADARTPAMQAAYDRALAREGKVDAPDGPIARSRVGVSLAEQTKKVLDTLTPREREVLDMRLGDQQVHGPYTRRKRCDMRSGITDYQCELVEGHAADTPTRFHRFSPREIAAAENDERSLRIQGLMSAMSLAKENGDFYRWLATTLVDLEDRLKAK